MPWFKNIFILFEEAEDQNDAGEISVYMILGGGDFREWFVETIGM